MVKVEWTPRARQDLRDIYNYYCTVKKSKQTAIAIKNKLIESSKILSSFPLAGPVEPLLADEPVCYRYLVVERMYKLIYIVEQDVASIVTVFDCRQSPVRMTERV